MTEAINFFQSFRFFSSFSNVKPNVHEQKLSKELIKDARKFVECAEAELKNGDKAKNLTLSSDECNLKQNLAQIAIWHLEVSAKYYRQAAARYDEARRLRPDQQKSLQRRADEILYLAHQTEANIKFLSKLNH